MKVMNYLIMKTNKLLENIKIEFPKNIWIDVFICLRSKAFSFKCGDDFKNKLKGISKFQTKYNKYEDY